MIGKYSHDNERVKFYYLVILGTIYAIIYFIKFYTDKPFIPLLCKLLKKSKKD